MKGKLFASRRPSPQNGNPLPPRRLPMRVLPTGTKLARHEVTPHYRKSVSQAAQSGGAPLAVEPARPSRAAPKVLPRAGINPQGPRLGETRPDSPVFHDTEIPAAHNYPPERPVATGNHLQRTAGDRRAMTTKRTAAI